DTKLYSGKVSSSRELGDLQSRGTDLRRQIDSSEEQLLKVMEQLETARAEAAEADSELRRIVAERRALEASLVAERKSAVAGVRTMTAERDQLRTQLDPANLRTYDRLRVRHGGLAVAEVKQRVCMGCRVTLTGAYEQRLRQGEILVTCQSCGRFLYYAN
ncbi:MAG: zinc ribbon domain-containing protein, partial [Chloroflexota bacterium]